MLTAQPFVQADSSLCLSSPPPLAEKPDMTAPRLVLKREGTMVMFNPSGLMPRYPDQALGMIVDDTRGLREFDVRLGGKPLVFVDGSAQASYAVKFHYENAVTETLEPHAIEVTSEFVIDNDLFHQLGMRNASASVSKFEVSITFDAGFEDTFEVRGSDRKEHGIMLAPKFPDGKSMQLIYMGLDNTLRLVSLEFAGLAPNSISSKKATYLVQLEPGERQELQIRIAYRHGADAHSINSSKWSYAAAFENAQADFNNWLLNNVRIDTANPELNRVIQRAVEDINMLRLGDMGIAAGLPQFAVPFGRDSCIAGLQTCWLMPDLTRQIILALASRQGTKYDATTAEEPGKIMHELRTGEMVKCGEAPFGPYYGTVDATQLWLMLITEHTKWTDDMSLVVQLWPNIEAAVKFLRRRSRRGYITYGGRPGEALANQCWKDSFNSIMYSDGQLAIAPIAVCEAQGYMYAAFVGIAKLADRLGKRSYARGLKERASILKKRFQKDFWVDRLGYISLALDKNGRQCDVISSNPGHLLGLGILSPRQERLVAKRLMQPDMFNGWFIRTLASSEVAYDEDDYQRGSGWPHDNGLACVGMRSIGHDEDAVRVFAAHVDIACAASDSRLHELYCGTARTAESKQPKHYKVACVPQAWAAGSILHMLRACLNPQPSKGKLRIVQSLLPDWLPWVTLTGVKVGAAKVDLKFTRTDTGETTCTILRKEKGVRVVIKASTRP